MAGIFVGKTPICSESTINPNQAEIQERKTPKDYKILNVYCIFKFNIWK